MEQEKKGLFGRLLEFWMGKAEEKNGGIGFWSGEKAEKPIMTEKMQEILPQGKAEKKAFWEETIQTAAEKKEKEEQEFLQKERKQFFSGEKTEEKKETALQTAEEKVQEKKTIVPIFTAEIFREETERRTEEERQKTIFLREQPLEERTQRKIVPIAEVQGSAKKAVAETEAEQPQEKEKKEREETKHAEIDIERLMREMTKRLWEERETSGRRLRG